MAFCIYLITLGRPTKNIKTSQISAMIYIFLPNISPGCIKK